VVAPPVFVTMPVSAGWLPSGLTEPAFWQSNQDDGQREVTYAQRVESGVETLEIRTRPAPPPAGESPGETPSWVSAEDRREVDLRDHRAHEYVLTTRSGGRVCYLTWQERPDLWIFVYVSEVDAGAGLDCGVGRRVAEGLLLRPHELARPVRPGLVPRGYTLLETTDRGEVWCPANGERHEPRCLRLRVSDGAEAAPSGPAVVVRGHDGRLDRTRFEVTLVVPGYLRLEAARGVLGPAIAELTDADVIRIAESAALPRRW
jgi:hypothetical protein